MADAEMIAEFVIILEEGLINRSESSINKIYKDYETSFENEDKYLHIIGKFFQILAEHFGALRDTFLMKPYAIHSFFAAYAHIKYGIPNGEEAIGFPCRGVDVKIDEIVFDKLLQVADAHETKDVDCPYGEYVKAAITTTTKAAQRKARTKVLAEILDPK